jgi:molybdenum-dependent DNA-binding transcriptional regulator ModE
MDFVRLRYFMAVAEAQSYSLAAAALNLSQPTLSRQVQLLEAELGQPLLERHGRGVRLTESGKAMLAHGRSISAAVDAAKADMAARLQSPRGKVRLGLPPLVASLVTRSPSVAARAIPVAAAWHGRLLVLEFSKPIIDPLSKAYDAYSFHILPRIGEMVANDAESYRYLAESIRMHPDQDTLKSMMQDAGFESVDYYNLTAGIVALHRGYKF